jgi:hypothetical protein
VFVAWPVHSSTISPSSMEGSLVRTRCSFRFSLINDELTFYHPTFLAYDMVDSESDSREHGDSEISARPKILCEVEEPRFVDSSRRRVTSCERVFQLCKTSSIIFLYSHMLSQQNQMNFAAFSSYGLSKRPLKRTEIHMTDKLPPSDFSYGFRIFYEFGGSQKP